MSAQPTPQQPYAQTTHATQTPAHHQPPQATPQTPATQTSAYRNCTAPSGRPFAEKFRDHSPQFEVSRLGLGTLLSPTCRGWVCSSSWLAGRPGVWLCGALWVCAPGPAANSARHVTDLTCQAQRLARAKNRHLKEEPARPEQRPQTFYYARYNSHSGCGTLRVGVWVGVVCCVLAVSVGDEHDEGGCEVDRVVLLGNRPCWSCCCFLEAACEVQDAEC